MTTPTPQPALSTAARAAQLAPEQLQAVEALLQGATQAEAARACGAGERTLRRWLRDPAFRVALQQARCDLWTETTSRLQQAATEAVEALLSALRQEQSVYARVLAARTVLEYTAKALDLDALAGRADQAEHDIELGLQRHVAHALQQYQLPQPPLPEDPQQFPQYPPEQQPPQPQPAAGLTAPAFTGTPPEPARGPESVFPV
ncbi:MAG TPA: helix-turn-helix domain-containing protein, partial [Armatimonadota bacterium]|nr:helix-turn-helix domain-containing protein [Armatimonadota bacterium]